MNKDSASFLEMRSPVAVEFKKEVLEGLRNSSKHLHSKYFYDQKGDALFNEKGTREHFCCRSNWQRISPDHA